MQDLDYKNKSFPVTKIKNKSENDNKEGVKNAEGIIEKSGCTDENEDIL